ncbi:ATP-binding protein [Candidatus Nitrotoga sp. 1052]|uniref:ATP-binding protein n=1 Tax=Candidatus Nitrotoga sp. 1052 TaxID=2886964 RepID=UPI001F97D3F0|nr:exported hypothetical protein [Candidatus Nitrotoga sp. 1052]
MCLLSGLWLLALVLFNSLAVEARYVGGEPPNQCAACGCVVCNASKQSSPSGSAPSYTEGNLGDCYSGGELPNSDWSGLDITIFRTAQAGIKTRFTTGADLLLILTTTHTQNQLKGVMHRAINSYRLLIIDEIGYLPMNREQANLCFQVRPATKKASEAGVQRLN